MSDQMQEVKVSSVCVQVHVFSTCSRDSRDHHGESEYWHKQFLYLERYPILTSEIPHGHDYKRGHRHLKKCFKGTCSPGEERICLEISSEPMEIPKNA